MCVEVMKIVFGKNDVQVVERLCNFGVILYDCWENDEVIEVFEEVRSIVEICDVSEFFICVQVLNYIVKVYFCWYFGLCFIYFCVMNICKYFEELDYLYVEVLKIYMDFYGDQQKFIIGVMMMYGIVKLYLGDFVQV